MKYAPIVGAIISELAICWLKVNMFFCKYARASFLYLPKLASPLFP